MSIPNIKARLEKLERDSPDDSLPITILLFPGMTEAEAIAEHDRRLPGTRDTNRPIQFIQIRAVNPPEYPDGTIQ